LEKGKCVDVFSVGAAGSNAPVTHAVFPIEIALVMANEKDKNIPLLDLDGPTLTVHSTVLSSMCTRFLNPSMIEGVDALLAIGKGKIEDQLLLLRLFLPQPIFPDGDLIFDDFMAHSKGGGRLDVLGFSRTYINQPRPLGLSSSPRKSSNKENS
jgi:hypothetical protein